MCFYHAYGIYFLFIATGLVFSAPQESFPPYQGDCIILSFFWSLKIGSKYSINKLTKKRKKKKVVIPFLILTFRLQDKQARTQLL